MPVVAAQCHAGAVGLGMVFALTIPGLAVLLVVLAVVERAASGLRRGSRLQDKERHALSAAASPPRWRAGRTTSTSGWTPS